MGGKVGVPRLGENQGHDNEIKVDAFGENELGDQKSPDLLVAGEIDDVEFPHVVYDKRMGIETYISIHTWNRRSMPTSRVVI